jgi:hypothetical protein
MAVEKGNKLFEDYEFKFEGVMSEKESRQVFKQYADEVCQCKEIFMFLDSVDKFKQDEKNRSIEAAKIIGMHIEPTSPFSINISGQIRKEILLKGKMDNMRERPLVDKHLFDAAYTAVVTELKQEMFPRFKRSAHLRKLIKEKEKKKDLDFLYRIAVYIPSRICPLYNLFPPLSLNNISDFDIELSNTLFTDSVEHWRVLEETVSNSYTTYKSVSKFVFHGNDIYPYIMDVTENKFCGASNENLPNSMQSASHIYKLVGNINYNLNDVMKAVTNPDFRLLYDNLLGTSTLIDYIPADKNSGFYPVAITIDRCPFPWPISCRDFITMNTIAHKDSSGQGERFYIIKKSTVHERAPPAKGTIRSIIFSVWILEKVSSNETRFIFIEYCDYKFNSITSRFFDKITKRKFNSMYRNLVKILEKYREIGFTETKDSLGLGDTLNDSMHQNLTTQQLESTLLKDTNQYIKRLTYISLYKKEMSPEECQRIGEISAKNNSKIGVTGLLLCGGGVFYQVLEGKPECVDKVYSKILNDHRHKDIRILSEENDLTENDRQFPVWSMNTVNLNDQEHYYCQFMKQLITITIELQNLEKSAEASQDEIEELTAQVISKAGKLFKKEFIQ